MIYKNVNGTQKLVTNIRKPKKWKRFEYLLSNGNQWINTEVTITLEAKVILDFLYVTNRTSSRMCGGTLTNCEFWWSTDNKFHFYSNTGSNVNTGITADTNRHTFIYDNANLKAYLDNTSFNFTTPVNNPGFTLYKANNGSYNKAAAKIYEFIIYVNTNVIMHLVPCQYNGQYGMWDLVEDKFYGNKGTGAFTVGPEIANYDEVEKLKVPLVESGIMNLYHLPDSMIYREPDGTKWLRIFHHNTPESKIFASTDTFTTYVYKDEDRWFNVAICNELSSWEFLVKLKLLSTDTIIYLYRWSQNKNPMTATFDDVARANVTYNTSGYNTTAYGGLYKKNGSTYLCGNNGVNGNWWGAIGAWANHLSGIPAWNGLVVKSGYMDLYVRIDNQPLKEIPVWVLKNALINSTIGAYINTGVFFDSTKNYVFETKFKTSTASKRYIILGSYNGTPQVNFEIYTDNKLRLWVTSEVDKSIVINSNLDHTLRIEYISGGTWNITLDDISKTFTKVVSGTNSKNFRMFCDHRSNSWTTFNNPITYYYMYIYENGELIRKFVPATMGGRPGLYDKVNHKMYFNANSSGNFTVE